MKKTISIIILILSFVPSFGQNRKELQQKAENGDSYSQFQLGMLYKEENKLEIAVHWFQRAACMGAPMAQYQLALCLINGEGIKKDLPLGFTWTLQATKQGFPFAQILTAKLYTNGDGTGKDLTEAFKWWERCANYFEQPNASKDPAFKYCAPEAQFNLGICYANGKGIDVDLKKSFEWMTKSAQNGYPDGLYAVGYAYLTGKGTKQDYKKAFLYLTEGANKKSSYAQYYLGCMYYYGDGISKNFKEAIRWWTEATKRGMPDAYIALGRTYEYGKGNPQNNDKAIEWYTKAAEHNYPPAQTQLGWLYYKLNNYKDAYAWFTKATEVNYPEGYNGLAYCYFDGKGVTKDTDKAIELINQALTLSNDDPRYLDTKGEFLYKIGQTDKAQEIYDKIQKEYPQYYTENKSTTLYGYFNNKGGNSDVDQSIPMTASTNSNTFAIIIANEKYQREKDVPYAINDGKIFADYCQKAIGIPEKNIHLVQNATLNDIKYHLNWLKQVIDVYGKDSKVIIYYAGHGVPDEKSKTAYLLPVDGYGNDISTGYSLQELYQTLGQLQSKEVVAFLDACFSGTNREGDMMQAARGVAIKVKETAPKGNLVVFSASKEDETAYPYKEKQHGMFTYYLLKKLQESKGNATLEDLCNYVTDNVRKLSIVENGKLQNPTVFASPTLGKNWETWKLK